jgi:homogentisate 1,2-dioxygenase
MSSQEEPVFFTTAIVLLLIAFRFVPCVFQKHQILSFWTKSNNNHIYLTMTSRDHHNASFVKKDGLSYQSGFGNSFESEVIRGALPRGRNNPKSVPFGLYAEQLSGTAFTSPRHGNRRTWLYRIQPSVTDRPFETEGIPFGSVQELQVDPNPMRWGKLPLQTGVNFVSGMKTFMSSGSPLIKNGLAISMYSFDEDMRDVHIYNSDGDFMIVPQEGSLRIDTELGRMVVSPNEICVLPRGLIFSVHKLNATDPPTRGYVLEVYKGHFDLPELGPIGSNGLANARDFLHPTAWCVSQQENKAPCTIHNKFGGQLFTRQSPHSPYNVVAWHGNYVPFIYDLTLFCAVNSVTYDHLDPSIYTVLTVAGSEPGTALADFVIFPPRVMATDSNTLRPPWFHRNCMGEFMGLIQGGYDAKEGFVAGGASLHSCMTPHGPDSVSYDKAVADPCEAPVKFTGGLAFMFETSMILELTKFARDASHRDLEYAKCWSGLVDSFSGWDLLLEEGESEDREQ